MTPQRINGFIAVWDGRSGLISVQQSQVSWSKKKIIAMYGISARTYIVLFHLVSDLLADLEKSDILVPGTGTPGDAFLT